MGRFRLGAAHLMVMTKQQQRAESTVRLLPDPVAPVEAVSESADVDLLASPFELPADDDTLLTAEQVAAWLTLPEKTLAHWRTSRKGPLPVTTGTRVRYRVADLRAWLHLEVEAARTKWVS